MSLPCASEFFIGGIYGPELLPKEQKILENTRFGGIILFKRNIQSLSQVIRLNSQIIKTNIAHPPILSVDQEGGRVARLRGICSDLPPMANLCEAFLKHDALAYRIGAMMGRELVALGFNLNFAPVCDVLLNTQNQVIGDRAISSSVEVSQRLLPLLIKGMQGSGLAACAKHFPGHGEFSVDSHFALPKIDKGLDWALLHELKVFDSAIKAQVATIMAGHLVYQAIDLLPASMSCKILFDLLREALGFSGLVISDDLDMNAISDNFSLTETITKGFLASTDLFIIGNDIDKLSEAINILQRLIDTDEQIRLQAINASQRIKDFRKRYLGCPEIPDLLLAQQIVRSKPHLELIKACT